MSGGRVRSAVLLWISPRRLESQGSTPDYRFSLANERTFLAWIRTSLALIAGGVAVDQFLSALNPGVRTTIAVSLLAGGALCAIRAVHHWARCELAMRKGEDLPASRFPALVAVGTALAAALIAVTVVLGVYW